MENRTLVWQFPAIEAIVYLLIKSHIIRIGLVESVKRRGRERLIQRRKEGQKIEMPKHVRNFGVHVQRAAVHHIHQHIQPCLAHECNGEDIDAQNTVKYIKLGARIRDDPMFGAYLRANIARNRTARGQHKQ